MKIFNPMIALSVLLMACVTEEDVTDDDLVEEGAEADDTIIAAALGTIQPEFHVGCWRVGWVSVTSSTPGHVRCPMGTYCKIECGLPSAWQAARKITMRFQQRGTCNQLHGSGRWLWTVTGVPTTTWKEGSWTLPSHVSLGSTYTIQVPNDNVRDWGSCELKIDYLTFD